MFVRNSNLFSSFWSRTVLGRTALCMMLFAVPASCLLPGYLARLTIQMFSDTYALQDRDYNDMA